MLEAIKAGILNREFVGRQPEETQEQFEKRRNEWPWLHLGESEQECAQRLQAVTNRRREQHESYVAALKKELAELDVREPFLNTLYSLIHDECLSIRVRRYDIQSALERANKANM